MHSTKTLLMAAALALTTASGIGAASAAPFDRQFAPMTRHEMRGDMRHMVVDRERVFESLRRHHLRVLSNPHFVRDHYVVTVAGRFGRPMLVEVDPFTGAILGTFRI